LKEFIGLDSLHAQSHFDGYLRASKNSKTSNSETLYLSSTKTNDDGLKTLARLKKLQVLYLDGTPITADDVGCCLLR
jgi:predicted transposase YbfD/YdcC